MPDIPELFRSTVLIAEQCEAVVNEMDFPTRNIPTNVVAK